jgi:hypothetical protein
MPEPDLRDLPMRRVAHATCTVDGCHAPHSARGLCRKHYMRALRTGVTGHPNDTRADAPAPRRADSDIDDALRHGGTLTLEQWQRVRP